MPTARFFKRIALTAHGTFGRVVGWSMDRNERKVGKFGGVHRFFGIAMDEGGGAHNSSAVF